MTGKSRTPRADKAGRRNAAVDALELFVIAPTTIEGRRALLQFLVQREGDGISEPIGEIAAKLLRLPTFAA
jgi:hypothetical protein